MTILFYSPDTCTWSFWIETILFPPQGFPMLSYIWLTTEDHLSRGQSNLNVMLYLFNYLFFGNTLTSDNTLLGAMSCNLLFIFDHPIICRTVKYIDQSENSLLLKCVLYHVHACTAVVSYRSVYMHQVPEDHLSRGQSNLTVLPILFHYCCEYCYSDSRNLWVVMKTGGLAL